MNNKNESKLELILYKSAFFLRDEENTCFEIGILTSIETLQQFIETHNFTDESL
jgi:hypothetical protein